MKEITLNIPAGVSSEDWFSDFDGYPEFSQSVKDHFAESIRDGKKLFTTNVKQLYETYINNLPEQARQHYNCNTCKRFIENYGGLVTISESGTITSALWHTDNTPKFFLDAIEKMKKLVEKSSVNGVFISSTATLGTPTTGEWNHLSVQLPRTMVSFDRLKNQEQLMAEKKEEYRIVVNAIDTFNIETVEKSISLLKTETLYRGDRYLPIAEWFKDLIVKRTAAKTKRNNLTWLFVGTAPVGFCHIKSSMIGTLLEDIQDGMDFEKVSRRFKEKMNPANFQRSQSAPTVGGIKQAEQIIEKLGIANSLRRRYTTFEEIPMTIWVDKKPSFLNQKMNIGGIFSNITPKEKSTPSPIDMSLPTTIMTFEKFKKTVLPSADMIEVLVDNQNRFMAMVTAADPTSENILQWDNPFSWYYHGGIDGEIKRRVEEAGGQYSNAKMRCSLIWESFTDLDLHCRKPNGDHIYYGNKKSGYSDGWLDVDMNAGGGSSKTPVENIVFSKNVQEGAYEFYIHNYCQRGDRGPTPFKVELEIDGQVYHFSGMLRDQDRVTAFQFIYKKDQKIEIKASAVTSKESWNLSMNNFVKVKGITTSPNLWQDETNTRSGVHTFFLLDGCKDNSEGKGRGFFTETLRSDLKDIRKTLEAYTANTPIEGIEESTACGVGYSKDSEWNLVLRITSNNSTRLIKIDRID